MCQAFAIEGSGQFYGTTGTEQTFTDGAIIIKQGESNRLVQPDIFQRTYNNADGSEIDLDQIPKFGEKKQLDVFQIKNALRQR